MARATATEIRARLVLYLTAEQKVLHGQAYSINNRSLTRADLSDIQKEIKLLRSQELAASRGYKMRVQRVVPRDI